MAEFLTTAETMTDRDPTETLAQEDVPVTISGTETTITVVAAVVVGTRRLPMTFLTAKEDGTRVDCLETLVAVVMLDDTMSLSIGSSLGLAMAVVVMDILIRKYATVIGLVTMAVKMKLETLNNAFPVMVLALENDLIEMTTAGTQRQDIETEGAKKRVKEVESLPGTLKLKVERTLIVL